MRSLFYLVLAVFAAVAAAQNANPFNIPSDGYSFKAGAPTALSWKPTTKGTISLILQWGEQIRPQTGIAIASHIPNSGSFTWTPQSTLLDRSDYTIEIFDDSTGQYNFLPRFSIAGVGKAATTGAMTTSTAPQTTTSAVSTTTAPTTTTTTGTSKTTTTGMTTTTTDTAAAASSSTMTTKASSSAASTKTKGTTTTTSKTTSSSGAPSSTVPSMNGGVVNRASSGFLALAMAVVVAM